MKKKTLKDKMGKWENYSNSWTIFGFCLLGICELYSLKRPCFRLYHFSVELPFQWEMYIRSKKNYRFFDYCK